MSENLVESDAIPLIELPVPPDLPSPDAAKGSFGMVRAYLDWARAEVDYDAEMERLCPSTHSYGNLSYNHTIQYLLRAWRYYLRDDPPPALPKRIVWWQDAHHALDKVHRCLAEIKARDEKVIREVQRALEYVRQEQERLGGQAEPIHNGAEVERTGQASAPPASHSLTFRPGMFVYRGHQEPLKGKPWQVLQFLAQARCQTCTADDLLKSIWEGTAVEEETVRSAVSYARKALRRAMKAVGVAGTDNPIPTVDRGQKLLAWHLALS